MDNAFEELVKLLDDSEGFEVDSSASPKILVTYVGSDGNDTSMEIIIREI